MRESFKKISGHGVVPIIIGTAVTVTGHSQMFIRGVALVACALWVSLDIGIALSTKKWPIYWKMTIFSVWCCFSCCMAMYIMGWFLRSTLEDQQSDTAQNLSADVDWPSNPSLSVFRVTNGGRTDISQHKTFCYANWIDFTSGPRITDSPIHYDAGLSNVIMHSGGDSESDACLAPVMSLGPLKSADIKLQFYYALETQPDIHKRKEFRFIGRWYDNSFRWFTEPIDAPTVAC